MVISSASSYSPQNKSEQPLRVQWAIDLKSQATQLYKRAPTVLRYILQEAHAIIEPVYVLRLNPEVSPDFTIKRLPEYFSAAEDLLVEQLKELKIQNTMRPRVIYHDSLSTRGAVDTLIDDAVKSGAQLIVAQTHSRKGINRLFLGSFAETLLFRSKLPVLLVGKEMKPFHGIKTILFPTDFSKRAHVFLDRVIEVAQTFHSKVLLFHSVQHPIEPIGTGFYPEGPLGPFSEYVKAQIQQATHKANAWISIAEKQGVEMNFVMDERGQSIWDKIISLAQSSKADLIAIEAQSGPVSSSLLGSVTRQIVRHSPCPVLVLKGKTSLASTAPIQSEEAGQLLKSPAKKAA